MSPRVPVGSRGEAGDFYLDEFVGWEHATPLQRANLEKLVDHVLQPIRDRFGKVVPTSWIYWRNGAPRTGVHGTGGAVDFVTTEADLEEVFRWAAGRLWGDFGEMGYTTDPEHIHVTLPPLGGTNDVWVKDARGRFTRPFWYADLPGIDVEVPGGAAETYWPLLALALLLLAGAKRGGR